MRLGGVSRELVSAEGPKLGGCILSVESRAGWQTDLGKVDVLSFRARGSDLLSAGKEPQSSSDLRMGIPDSGGCRKEGRRASGEGHNRASGLGREGVALTSCCLRPWGYDPLNPNELLKRHLGGVCVWNAVRTQLELTFSWWPSCCPDRMW